MRTFERKTARRGFTLIEMLVVIVIIVILMGVVFKLTRGAMAKSDYAKEEKLVTLMRMLIEEFHAEYNIYPPVPVYETHDGKKRQPINFRGSNPSGKGTRAELIYYPGNWSYAKHNNQDCYFIFGLMSFFVDRSRYGEKTFEVNGKDGEEQVGTQWGSYNEPVGSDGSIPISQKDRAFAHRVVPLVAQVSGFEDLNYPDALRLSYDTRTGYCLGFTTGVYGQWADGIGEIRRDNKIVKIYDEGLVYISKPPYTTYLLFSKGPDDDYEEPADDRTLPKNKDNIYGNLGDK